VATLSNPVIVVSSVAAIPVGTPAGTVIVVAPTNVVVPPAAGPNVAGVGASVYGGTTGNLSLNTPSGIVNGDYLVAFIHSQSSAPATDFSAPAGWTRIGYTPQSLTESGNRYTVVYGQRVTDIATLPLAHTFTDVANAATGSRRVGVIVNLRGVGSGTITSSDKVSATDNLHPVIPTKACQVGDLALSMVCATTAAPNLGSWAAPPAGWTEHSYIAGPNVDGTTSGTWMHIIGKTATGVTSGGETATLTGPTIAADTATTLVFPR